MERMTLPPLTLPRWLPLAAGVAALAWAVSIWWMVAALPAGNSTAGDENLALVGGQIDSLVATIDDLSSQIDGLQQERDTLLARVGSLESQVQPIVDAATAADEAAAIEEAAAADPTASEWFTDGKDRYNCRNFPTYAAAQEALSVNGPGDPNHIDGNKNGIACEDFAYPDKGANASTAVPSTSATQGVRQR